MNGKKSLIVLLILAVLVAACGGEDLSPTEAPPDPAVETLVEEPTPIEVATEPPTATEAPAEAPAPTEPTMTEPVPADTGIIGIPADCL